MRFGEKKLTKEIDSSISKLNICYYLKMPMPKNCMQFFSVDSQNPENVKSVCNDRYNPFLFGCRIWIINQ